MSKPIKWLLGLGLTLGFVFCVLAFGNPQWGQYVFRFQAYVWNSYEAGEFPVPETFTGTWKTWWSNGRLCSIEEYVSGEEFDGDSKYWAEDGTLESETVFENGGEKEYRRGWHSNGQLWYEGIRRKGKQGTYTSWKPDGVLNTMWLQSEKKRVIIFDDLSKIDRRKEFGIPIE